MEVKRFPWWVIVFWLAVWQMVSMVVGYSILCPSPWETLCKLWQLLGQSTFYLSMATTLGRICLGFFSATMVGVVLAVWAHRQRWLGQLLGPVILVFKSVPVASFTILILIWYSSSALAIIIAFIMVMPLVYGNTYTALDSLDPGLNEMATIFALTPYTKLRYVVAPQVVPYLRSACLVGLGMSFKAGIAAEVIGLPKNAIGEQLYTAKLYFDTPSVFAWTLSIIALSFCCEKLLAAGIDMACKQLEKVRWAP